MPAIDAHPMLPTRDPPPSDPHAAQRTSNDAHWARNLRLTAALLAVWFAVSFVATFFARDLNARWFGWPFGFWMAAQGAPLVYVLLVTFYAWRMRRLQAPRSAQEAGD